MTTHSKQFAKDVAVQLDRRRGKRRMVFLLGLFLLVLAGALYLRCGEGLGLGGSGKGTGNGTAAALPTGPVRCMLRVAATGITVDGKPMKRDAAVAACKKTEGALVTITGDARQGDWDDLRAALEKAGIKIFTRTE